MGFFSRMGKREIWARPAVADRVGATGERTIRPGKAGAASIPDIHGCTADFQQPECEEVENSGEGAGGNGLAG
jgi:hypothetical protein